MSWACSRTIPPCFRMSGSKGGPSWLSTRRRSFSFVYQRSGGSLWFPNSLWGAQNVIADSLSHQNQVLGFEWTFAQDVVNSFLARWPATVDQFATSLTYRLPFCFFPSERSDVGGHRHFFVDVGRAPGVCLPSLRPDPSGDQRVVGQQRDLHHFDRSFLATERVVSKAPESGCGSSGAPSTSKGSFPAATLPSPAPKPPRALSSCMATMQHFARNLRLSSRVATHLSLCRRHSSQRLYQHHWECYRSWCHSKGHSISAPSVAKIVDFLCFLDLEKHLSVSAIKGYHSTLSVVFKFRLLELVDSFVLCDLIKSF